MKNTNSRKITAFVGLFISIFALIFFIFGHKYEAQYVVDESCAGSNFSGGCVTDENGYVYEGDVDKLDDYRVPGIVVSSTLALVSLYFLIHKNRFNKK